MKRCFPTSLFLSSWRSAKKGDLGSRNERKRELSSRIEQLKGKNICPLCGSELSQEHIGRLHADVNISINATLDEIGIEKLGNTASLLGEISRSVNESISESQGKLERLSMYRESKAKSYREKDKLSNEIGEAADSILEAVEEEKKLKDLLTRQKDTLAELQRPPENCSVGVCCYPLPEI